MITTQQFRALMQKLATAWSTQDTELGLRCFSAEAVYMEPPDIQLYQGHAQLRPYFAALRPGMFMHWNALMFDEVTQTGAGEYTFGMTGKPQADYGVAVVQIEDGVIAFWREYQRKGPQPFTEFLAVEGKTWQWHIGNYP